MHDRSGRGWHKIPASVSPDRNPPPAAEHPNSWRVILFVRTDKVSQPTKISRICNYLKLVPRVRVNPNESGYAVFALSLGGAPSTVLPEPLLPYWKYKCTPAPTRHKSKRPLKQLPGRKKYSRYC